MYTHTHVCTPTHTHTHTHTRSTHISIDFPLLLHALDLGYCDSDGDFWIVDRIEELIKFNNSIVRALTHSLTCLLTYTLTHSLAHPLTHSHQHSPTHALTHPLTHSLTHSLSHTLARLLAHARIHSRNRFRHLSSKECCYLTETSAIAVFSVCPTTISAKFRLLSWKKAKIPRSPRMKSWLLSTRR